MAGGGEYCDIAGLLYRDVQVPAVVCDDATEAQFCGGLGGPAQDAHRHDLPRRWLCFIAARAGRNYGRIVSADVQMQSS